MFLLIFFITAGARSYACALPAPHPRPFSHLPAAAAADASAGTSGVGDANLDPKDDLQYPWYILVLP